MSAETRALDTAEVYIEVIDRIWSMNQLGVLELGEAVDADQVERVWARMPALFPVVGARVERTTAHDAHFVFDTRADPGPVARYDDVPTAFRTESRTPIDPATGPLVRCSLVEGADGVSVVLAGNHTALDGRAFSLLTLLFGRVLVGDDVSDHPLASRTLPLGRFTPPERDWRPRRGEMLATARRIREEDGFVGHAGPTPWHQPALEVERDPDFVTFSLSVRESSMLIDWAKSSGATVHGALSAAVLQTLETLTPGLTRAALSTTVDLRTRSLTPEAGAIGQAGAAIAGSYETAGDPAAVARAVSADIRRRVDRGEGELFFALSGVDRLPVGEGTDDVVRRWTASTTPSVCVANVGIVPDVAPEALRGIDFGLAPTPNQVAFVTMWTFRDQVFVSLGLDRNRLSIDPDVLARTLRDRLRAIADAT